VLKEPAVSDPSPSRWARPGGSLSDQERQLAGKNTIALNEQTTGEKDGDHTTENGNDVAEQNLPLPVLPKQFQLLGTIGHGGMGGVYKVHDVELRKTLAVKVIKPELSTDQAALKRFEQESLALSNPNHPNIVAVFASGKTETGAPYMVMDYIAGQSLSSAIQREGALSQKRAVPLFIEICDALHYAHDKHIIHRDLKPGNIILARGEHVIESARVVDFGIAKVLKKVTGETVTGLTQVGDFFGTPAYMSPEQCEGTQLDARADIYSFGCVMYETLSGAPPFTEKNPFKLMTKHVEERPALLAREGINPDLALVVAKCLEKKPEDRYQDVDQLMRDLVLIRDGNRPKHLSNKLSKMQLSGLIVMLVCVALGAISFLTPNSSSTTSNPVARLFGNETVPSIEVNTKPSISKPEPVKLTNVEPPPEVPLNGPPLSEEEAAQLKAALYNLTLTNQSTLQPVLQMGKRAIPALLEYVSGNDVGLARAASAVLTKYPKEALPRLVELFKTSDNRFISDTMEQSGGAGLRALSSLLTDSDAGVRTRALSGIADTGKPLPQNVSAIVVDTLLEDVDAETRSNAAR
ncbi:MAG: serine/threonine protein kinase, partial [Cyanobacteria bacterium]|nr:serine/threonine protein kinase [Cyanobacteriota bacterium]